MVDPRGIGPVGLDRDHREPAAQDELAGDARAHPVELRGAVRRLAEQHNPGIADALEQRVDRVVLDVAERLGRLAHELRHDLGTARARARRSGTGPGPLRPPLGADERDETHRAELLARIASPHRPPHAHELLGARRRPDRNHQPAADGELLEQGLGDLRAAGGNDDRVVRRMLRPAERAVAVVHVHVRIAELPQAPLRRPRELLVALDRIDLGRDAAQHGGRVAGSGADLEHAVARRELERRGHRRDDVRLRDRLPGLDRQRRVLVGELGELGGDERLTRHGPHRGEDRLVAEAAGHELLDHAAAFFAALIHRYAPCRRSSIRCHAAALACEEDLDARMDRSSTTPHDDHSSEDTERDHRSDHYGSPGHFLAEHFQPHQQCENNRAALHHHEGHLVLMVSQLRANAMIPEVWRPGPARLR